MYTLYNVCPNSLVCSYAEKKSQLCRENIVGQWLVPVLNTPELEVYHCKMGGARERHYDVVIANLTLGNCE